MGGFARSARPPVLLTAAFATGWRPAGLGRGIWLVLAISGLCFAGDLATWHMGILKTQLANATLFGNVFPIVEAMNS